MYQHLIPKVYHPCTDAKACYRVSTELEDMNNG